MKSMEQLLKDNYHGRVDADRTVRVIASLRELDRLAGHSAQYCKLFLKNVTNILAEEPEAIGGLAERVYDLHREAAMIIRNSHIHEVNDQRMEAHIFGHGGQVAHYLYQKEGDSAWLVEAFNMYEDAAKMTRNIDPGYAFAILGKAGEAAMSMVKPSPELEDKIYWASRAAQMFDDQFDLRQYVGPKEHKHIAHHREFAWKVYSGLTKKASDVRKYLSSLVDTSEIYLESSNQRSAGKLYEAGVKAFQAGVNRRYTKRDKKQFLKRAHEYTGLAQPLAVGDLKVSVDKLFAKTEFHLKNFKRRH